MTVTTTTTTLPSGRAEAAGVGRPLLLGRAVGAEWTKLRSVRSTYGSLLVAVVVTVGIAALAGWAAATDDQPTQATATQLAGFGASVGQFGLVALAALAVTTEFATGGIRTTLAATPARWAVLTAKAAVVGAVTFPAGFVATALATLAGSAILGTGTDAILAVSARSAAALTLTSMLVVGLGAVLRSAAGAITTAVAVLFTPPILGVLVSNDVVRTVTDYLPAGLSSVLVAGTGERYSPEMAALLLGAWAVGALAVGVIALQRRDP
jgi:ABC-2 type transport system permease protein